MRATATSEEVVLNGNQLITIQRRHAPNMVLPCNAKRSACRRPSINMEDNMNEKQQAVYHAGLRDGEAGKKYSPPNEMWEYYREGWLRGSGKAEAKKEA